MTSQVETNEVVVAPLATKDAWETPRVTSAAVSEVTYGGPTRGIETGGDIGPS
jgi:hypothetical protein